MNKEFTDKLELLAKIKKGDKLYLHSFSSPTILNSWYSSILRYWNQENRKGTLDFLTSLLQELNVVIRTLDVKLLNELEGLVAHAKNGIQNLKSTYKDDPVMKKSLTEYLLSWNATIRLIKIYREVKSEIEESGLYQSVNNSYHTNIVSS